MSENSDKSRKEAKIAGVLNPANMIDVCCCCCFHSSYGRFRLHWNKWSGITHWQHNFRNLSNLGQNSQHWLAMALEGLRQEPGIEHAEFCMQSKHSFAELQPFIIVLEKASGSLTKFDWCLHLFNKIFILRLSYVWQPWTSLSHSSSKQTDSEDQRRKPPLSSSVINASEHLLLCATKGPSRHRLFFIVDLQGWLFASVYESANSAVKMFGWCLILWWPQWKQRRAPAR